MVRTGPLQKLVSQFYHQLCYLDDGCDSSLCVVQMTQPVDKNTRSIWNTTPCWYVRSSSFPRHIMVSSENFLSWFCSNLVHVVVFESHFCIDSFQVAHRLKRGSGAQSQNEVLNGGRPNCSSFEEAAQTMQGTCCRWVSRLVFISLSGFLCCKVLWAVLICLPQYYSLSNSEYSKLALCVYQNATQEIIVNVLKAVRLALTNNMIVQWHISVLYLCVPKYHVVEFPTTHDTAFQSGLYFEM